jgi:hypothetical protein
MEVSGQLHAPAVLPPRERAPRTHWIGGWVSPRAVLDEVVKRKIPSPRRKSNPRTPIVQPVAQRYTDWAITALANIWTHSKCVHAVLFNWIGQWIYWLQLEGRDSITSKDEDVFLCNHAKLGSGVTIKLLNKGHYLAADNAAGAWSWKLTSI